MKKDIRKDDQTDKERIKELEEQVKELSKCNHEWGYLQWYDACNWYRECEKGCGERLEGYERD